MHVSTSTDILIAGGSFVGLATAIGLAQAGLMVTVVERRQHTQQAAPGDDGRVSAIALGTRHFLGRLGIWDAVQEAQPIEHIDIVDGNLSRGDSRRRLHYDHRQVGRDPFGWMVPNHRLLAACWDRAGRLPNLHLRQGVGVADWQAEGAGLRITLEGGDSLTTRLLLAADGKYSGLRRQAGIAHHQRVYGQTALVGCVAHARPHKGLATERFLPHGPFAQLPMTDGQDGSHRSAYVWTESDALAKAFFALPEADYRLELQRRFGESLGRVHSLGGRWLYPLDYLLPERLTAERFALIGDAAHGMHPVAGQGVNLGLRDSEALLDLIVRQARLGLDIGAPDLLQGYADSRRFDIHSMLEVTDGLVRLFSNDWFPLRAARRFGLGLVEQLPPVKKLFMRHAMGLLLPGAQPR